MAYEIDLIESVIVDLPLRRLQQFSAVGAQSQSVVLVFVSTRDGLRGVGEAVTPSGPWWSGESVETIKAMVDEYLAPLVVGESAFDRIAIMDKMDGKVFGNAFAKAGIEMALWDIQGKALGQPVYNLLGGKVRDALPVSWPLATGEADAEIAEAEEKIAAGLHNIFKLKMGALDPQTDVDRATRVARGLEGRARVRIDPNERWDETILRWAAPRLAEAGVELIEQPLPRWNLDGAARFTSWAPLTHMLDESVCSLHDMVEVARRGAAGAVSLKVMKSKGLAGAKLVGDAAQGLGAPIYMGTFLETSYGTGASMQLCATLKDLPYGGELAGPLLLSEDIATTPARYHDFQLHLQEGVGLGVEVDPDKLRAFRRDKTYSLHAVTV